MMSWDRCHQASTPPAKVAPPLVVRSVPGCSSALLPRGCVRQMVASDAAAAGELDWAWLVGLRRAIHMRPEGGFREVGTRAAIRHALLTRAGIPEAVLDTHPAMGAPHHSYGFDADGCSTTGMIVDIAGTGPEVPDSEKRTIMMRADMDALQMTEENGSLPYRSRFPGLAHMCGHDGHMAALIGAAVLLNSPAVRRCIPSNSAVRLLFQPAEETPGGAEPMIKDGALEGVDEVYGWHNWPTSPVGTMLITDGTIMAHDADFRISIKGRGGHGSAPHVCIDPVPCGAAIVMALQTIVSRTLPSASNAVVSVTSALPSYVPASLPPYLQPLPPRQSGPALPVFLFTCRCLRVYALSGCRSVPRGRSDQCHSRFRRARRNNS
jgi:metal-dependent amidase/aminoacylase/carboxypeptidase family protein